VLAEVVAQDPTHMVANKLLVEARLRCGDAAGARERLDLYRLLNDGDPEIAGLAERLAALTAERRPAPAAPPAPPAVPDFAPPAAPAPEPAAGPPPAATPPAPAPPPEWTAPPAPPAPSGSPRRPAWAGSGEPFAALLAAGDRRRYLTGLAAGGIFPVALPPEPAPAIEAAAVELPPEIEPAPAAAPPPGPAAVAGREAEAPEPARPPLEAEGAAEGATVTLGQLYLDQQHYAEAERIFRAVLERDPGNAAALLGLGEVERLRPRPLTAHQLLSWAAGREGAAAAVRRPRRRVLLQAYLTRIREGAHADVP
jgi:hypothetical protein